MNRTGTGGPLTGWAWRVGAIAGIGIYVHGTFVLLIGFLVLSEWLHSRSLTAALVGVGFVLAVFATIVLHELGHALTARRFGIRTRDITLLPIGGVARLERIPEVPRQELWVALAGPAVNVGLALIVWILLFGAAGRAPAVALAPTGGMVDRFIAVNLWLALFNLVPAFPMDGGRALRALLAERLDYVRATEIAATIGQGLALVFGFVGLFTNPFLLFIALFVWMGASAEASMVSARAALAGIPVSRAMITDFHTLRADDPLERAVELVLAGSQRDFPVVDGETLVGVLTRDALLSGLARHGPIGTVRDVMIQDFEVVDPRDLLEPAFARLQACQCPVVPVVYRGRLVGLLTPENVTEYLMIRGALRPPSRGM